MLKNIIIKLKYLQQNESLIKFELSDSDQLFVVFSRIYLLKINYNQKHCYLN